MNKSIFAFFSLVVLTIAITASACSCAHAGAVIESGKAAKGKVVMVIADYLGIEDINEMDFVSRMAGESHIALMNNRQPGKAFAGKSKLIIGSGKRLELNSGMVQGGSGKDSMNLYRIQVGMNPAPGDAAYADIQRIKDRNKESKYNNYIGYIGDVINKNKGAACFLGNADTDGQNRSSMLIAVDSRGMVDFGETESILMDDEMFPYGKRTDYNKLAELYKQYLPASSFIVIDTGDMERLEAFRPLMSVESYQAYKDEVLTDIDGFLEWLASYGGFKTLIFISTYPSKTDADENNRLTPVVVYEAGEEGLLYSRSTRREGIILNTDLADYILCKLGYASFSNITGIKKEGATHFLEGMNGNITRTSALRAPVLTYYAALVMAALGIIFVNAALLPRLASLIAYIILSMPAAFLFMPASYFGGSAIGYFALCAAVSLFLSLALQIIAKDKIKVILIICLLLLLGLFADISAGSPLIKQSVLGYDPVIGARFYGIGNEYAGIFIGCSLMAIGFFQELGGKKLKKAVSVPFFVVCIFTLGFTLLGANFGGALAGAAGYILAYFLIYGIKFSKRNIFVGAFILSLTAAALITADSLGMSSPSHMGALVKDTGMNGLGVIISTAERKISMNLRLIRYTIWTKVLLSIIAIITIMFFRPVRILQSLFNRYKHLKYSWISTAAAAIVGFGVNDSGIVLAATAMIYAAFTMLIMCMGERNDS